MMMMMIITVTVLGYHINSTLDFWYTPQIGRVAGRLRKIRNITKISKV